MSCRGLPRLLETDAIVYRKLCQLALDLMDYPGAEAMARMVGYRDGDSVRASLHRLARAGYVRIEGGRQASAIVLTATQTRIPARKCAAARPRGMAR